MLTYIFPVIYINTAFIHNALTLIIRFSRLILEMGLYPATGWSQAKKPYERLLQPHLIPKHVYK
jgi:hypothetical protein